MVPIENNPPITKKKPARKKKPGYVFSEYDQRKGGKTRWNNVSPAQRKKWARSAAINRWARFREDQQKNRAKK